MSKGVRTVVTAVTFMVAMAVCAVVVGIPYCNSEDAVTRNHSRDKCNQFEFTADRICDGCDCSRNSFDRSSLENNRGRRIISLCCDIRCRIGSWHLLFQRHLSDESVIGCRSCARESEDRRSKAADTAKESQIGAPNIRRKYLICE